MSYSKKLAEQMCNMVSTLSNRFPSDKKLSMACTALNTHKLHNNKQLTSFYLTQIYLKKNADGKTFKKLIQSRDDSFFVETYILDDAGEQMATDMNLGNNKADVMVFLENLRAHWEDLRPDEKNSIWSYFDVLNLLAERYMIQSMKKLS